MSGLYLKRYPDPRTRQRAVANYSWLAGLEPIARLPRLRPAPDEEHLMFEHVNGRHARPEDLPLLAASLGDMHGDAHARELHQARLPQRYPTRAGTRCPASQTGASTPWPANCGPGGSGTHGSPFTKHRN